MKFRLKSVLAATCAAVLVTVGGFGVFAATTSTAVPAKSGVKVEVRKNGDTKEVYINGEKVDMNNLTDAQKAVLDRGPMKQGNAKFIMDGKGMKEIIVDGKKVDFENLTDEQKAVLEEKRKNFEAEHAKREAEFAEKKSEMEARQKKWDALSDEKKEEFYKLADERIDLKIKAINKYVESGLMDKEDADEAIERLTEQKAKIRANGKMPMLMDGHHGPKGEPGLSGEKIKFFKEMSKTEAVVQ